MAALKERLREEARKQGLPYGILVEEIDGGFTLTGREMPNAFNVRASASWRVYVDGRPDELVRGIDLVGTPLVAFGNLIVELVILGVLRFALTAETERAHHDGDEEPVDPASGIGRLLV